MKRREALGLLIGTCSLAGCSETDPRTTTERTTRAFDMPPRETLTGWPTYRAHSDHTGVVSEAAGPDGRSLDTRWRAKFEASWPLRISIAGGVAFAARGRLGVAAFDLSSGDRVAADVATGDAVTTEVAVHDGTAYFGTHAGDVVAANAATGDREWEVRTNRFLDESEQEDSLPVSDSTPAVDGGRVYAGGPTAEEKPDGTAVFCIEDGEVRWRFETSQKTVGSPVVADERVYARFETAVAAIDAADGSEIWRASFEDVVAPDYRPKGDSPAVGDGAVFFSGPDGRVFGYDAATGERRWAFETDGPTGLDSSAVRPAYAPAVTDERVFVGTSSGQLYAIDAATGDPAWQFEPDERVVYWTTPAVAGDTVYVGANPPDRDNDGSILGGSRERSFVFAVDAETGSLRARYEGSGLASPPAVGDDAVVVGFVPWEEDALLVTVE